MNYCIQLHPRSLFYPRDSVRRAIWVVRSRQISITLTGDSELNKLSLYPRSKAKCITNSMCAYVYVCVGACTRVSPFGMNSTCMNSFCGAANANELPNSTIRFWQMKTLTYSRMEIHRFQCSRFLNHHSWAILWLCMAVTFWTAIDSNGTFMSMDHSYSDFTRDEIAECNVGGFYYHWWLVMSNSDTEQSLQKSGNWGGLTLQWLRLSNTNVLCM